MSKLKYSIITEIKKSDKGSVYLAKADNYNFPVIVKEIEKGNIEVYKALKEIESKYLPKIFSVEEIESGILLAEEYVEGELLSDYIAAQRLNEDECFDIANQLCAALKLLHNQEPALIHRDIKPSNIIVGKDGVVKLIDFDSSRLYKEEAEADTRLLGTEKYAPPEQYGFSQTDCRSDIYSLGVVLEKLTVFISKDKKRKWKSIVEKCTLFSPDSRFQKVEEIERELEKFKSSAKYINLAILAGIVLVLVIAVIISAELRKTKAEVSLLESDQVTDENLSDEEVPAENIVEEDVPDEDVPDEDAVDEEVSNGNSVDEDVIVIEDVLDEQYKTILPEFRDLESDPEQYAVLKNRIRVNQMLVVYHFKDRMQDRDFLLHVKELDYDGMQFFGMKIYNELGGIGEEIDKKYVTVKDNVVIIDNEYMNSLPNGYYTLATVMGTNSLAPMEKGIYLNVAGSDILEEPAMWLQHSTYEYQGGDNEKVHMVLKNDSSQKISSVQYIDGIEFDKKYYQILQNGRVLELSLEYLGQLVKGQMISLEIVCEDGSSEIVTVTHQ